MNVPDFEFSLSRQVAKPYIRVVFDLETHLIAPCVQAPPIVALGFRVDGGKPHIVMANDSAFGNVVRSLISDDRILLVGHHVRFDFSCLVAHFGDSEETQQLLRAAHMNRVTCTLTREALLRVARANPMTMNLPLDLGTCCAQWNTPTQPNKSDPWRLRWGTLAELHVAQLPQEAVKYLNEDLLATDELYVAQESKAPWLKNQFDRTRAAIALYLTQCWGLRTDRAAADKLYAETEAELAEAAAICQSTLQTYTKLKTRTVKGQKFKEALQVTEPLVRPDGRRNKKAAEQRMLDVCAANGLDAPRGEPTERMLDADENASGQVKLDDDACEKSRDPVLVAYSKVSQATGLLAKVARLKHPVIQPSFNPLVATGRTSCRQGDDPAPGEAPRSYGFQTQNPPRAGGLRNVFVARPGRLLSSVDYDSFEMSAWAQVCLDLVGKSKLAEILADPKRDMHVEMAAQIHGMPPENLYALKVSNPKKYKELRQIGKPANFGLPGGLGAARFVDFAWTGYGLTLTEAEAKTVKKKWSELYVEAPLYFDYIADKVRSAGGRWRLTQLRSGRVRGGCSFTEACNGFFQSLAADAALEAGWRLVVHMYGIQESALFGSRLSNFLHDEWIACVPKRSASAAAKLQTQIQIQAAKEYMPDVRVSASPCLMERWYKEADPMYNEQGDLIPWQPSK